MNFFQRSFPNRPKRVLALLGIICCLSANVHAQSAATKKMQQIRRSIHRDANQLLSLQRQLKKNELKSSQIHLTITRLDKSINKHSHTIGRLSKKQNNYQQQLDQQLSLFTKQIEASYLLHKQPTLKLLLDHQGGDDMLTMLTYYHYLNEARAKNITLIQSTLTKLKQNSSLLKKKQYVLSQIKEKKQGQKRTLTNRNHKRQALIDRINKRMKGRKSELFALEKNRQELNKAVRKLDQSQQHGPISTQFAKLRGRLTWPTVGRLITHFGQSIGASQLRRTGVIIKASSGQNVRAVAAGRVVFAKWLMGYGQLLIINHGNGYMTLYGRNQNIFKQVGQQVRRGDIIATVGNTGGNPTTGLYFAIRHNATSLNPSRWCKKINARNVS